MATHCPRLIKICWASTARALPLPLLVKAGLWASSWWEPAPSEAVFLFAFSAPGICDFGQGICLLTMSFSSFPEGKHSVHWFLWLNWLVAWLPSSDYFSLQQSSAGGEPGGRWAAHLERRAPERALLWAPPMPIVQLILCNLARAIRKSCNRFENRNATRFLRKIWV